MGLGGAGYTVQPDATVLAVSLMEDSTAEPADWSLKIKTGLFSHACFAFSLICHSEYL